MTGFQNILLSFMLLAAPAIVFSQTAIETAINDLIAEVNTEVVNGASVTMGPKFLRLAFHDCVGGCDGCVDLQNPENNGLELPINTLQKLVEKLSLIHI